MAGIGTIFQGAGQGFSVARTLGRLAVIAQRPNFELQFSILQNKLIDQLAKKIENLNDKSVVNNVDVFLELEKKRLQRLTPLIDRFKNQTFMNMTITNGVIDNLGKLKTLASGSDATAFDNLLAKIDKELLSIRKVSGLAIGFNVRDGLVKARDEGLGISDFGSCGAWSLGRIGRGSRRRQRKAPQGAVSAPGVEKRAPTHHMHRRLRATAL